MVEETFEDISYETPGGNPSGTTGEIPEEKSTVMQEISKEVLLD